jgi:hypothetical protein
MAAITRPEISAQQTSAQQTIDGYQKLTLPSTLNEPHASTIAYAAKIAKNPNLDQLFCQQAGKIVHIAVQFSEKVGQVAIRGSSGPLKWTSDRLEDTQTTTDFYNRTFTFLVPQNQINDKIEFKFCLPAIENVRNGVQWSKGDNWMIDLSKYGHIAIVEVSNVSF